MRKYRQEYYDRLNMVRDNGDFEQWIAFFLKGIVVTADSAVDAAKRIMELQSRHRNLLWQKKISSPLAFILCMSPVDIVGKKVLLKLCNFTGLAHSKGAWIVKDEMKIFVSSVQNELAEDNAWDADAANVRIKLPKPMTAEPIVVGDDGTGMTEVELRRHYLSIATDRRARRGDLTTVNKRKVKGRKRIGKFAGPVTDHSFRFYSLSCNIPNTNNKGCLLWTRLFIISLPLLGSLLP